MKIRWLRRAQDEHLQAARYIAADNLKAALEVYDEIGLQVARLEDHPLKGRPGRRQGTRELVILRTPYLVIYRVGAKELIVMRVLHGARQWPTSRS